MIGPLPGVELSVKVTSVPSQDTAGAIVKPATGFPYTVITAEDWLEVVPSDAFSVTVYVPAEV
jgi:hypothetical protein